MAMRSAAARALAGRRSVSVRLFSDGKGKVLSEEERAAETIYIQKMERERAEKLKLKMEKEKSKEAEKTIFMDYLLNIPSSTSYVIKGRNRMRLIKADAADSLSALWST